MPARACNVTLLDDTSKLYRSVQKSLHPSTSRSVRDALVAAGTAARAGRCAEMHRNAQHARALVERRLDALLGPPRRR